MPALILAAATARRNVLAGGLGVRAAARAGDDRTRTLEALRPLVSEAFVAVFNQRMTRGVERAFGRELEKRAKG